METMGSERADRERPALGGSDPTPLEIVESKRGADAVIRLAGELDIATGSRVIDATRRALRDQPARIMVDLNAVEFLDLTGLRTLIHCRRLASGKDCPVILTRPSAKVQQLLELTGLRAVFEIVD
jgi:anti-sigma B factor antagonist